MIIGSWLHLGAGFALRFYPGGSGQYDGGGYGSRLPMEWALSDRNIRIKVGRADGAGQIEWRDNYAFILTGFSYIHELNGAYIKEVER